MCAPRYYRWLATPRYAGNGLGRLRNIWTFLRAVWRDAPRLAREFRPDAVIASSTYPMDIWVARRIARRAGARLVYEVHDLWPVSPIELSGMSRRHPFALRRCTLFVAILEKPRTAAQGGFDTRQQHLFRQAVGRDRIEAAQRLLSRLRHRCGPPSCAPRRSDPG